jgi:hypothetical protein
MLVAIFAIILDGASRRVTGSKLEIDRRQLAG